MTVRKANAVIENMIKCHFEAINEFKKSPGYDSTPMTCKSIFIRGNELAIVELEYIKELINDQKLDQEDLNLNVATTSIYGV